MPIWIAKNIEEQPSITLEHWRIIETSQQRCYFLGYSLEDRAGRISTPIQSFDPQRRRGITRSGRVYELRGEPGVDAHSEYVLAWWVTMKKLDVSDITDVTDQFTNAEL